MADAGSNPSHRTLLTTLQTDNKRGRGEATVTHFQMTDTNWARITDKDIPQIWHLTKASTSYSAAFMATGTIPQLKANNPQANSSATQVVARCYLPHYRVPHAHSCLAVATPAPKSSTSCHGSPLASHAADADSNASYGTLSTAFQTDNKEIVKTATSINASHLYKQHSMDPEECRKPASFLVETELLPSLSARQDTNRCKHKSFNLVRGFTKGRCGDVTGEEQLLRHLPPWLDMTDYNHTWLIIESCSDVTENPELLQRGGSKFATHMLRVYEAVTVTCSSNWERLLSLLS